MESADLSDSGPGERKNGEAMKT